MAYRERRKITPQAQAVPLPRRADGTPDDDNRVEIGPTALAFAEWAAAGIKVPQLEAMRQYRLQRLVAGINARELDGVILFDPLNIRYASDTTNMQLWNMHNAFRACFVGADGYMIVWDYKADDLLTAFNPLVCETRGRASFFYFVSGEGKAEDARRFAAELLDVMHSHGAGHRRLAVDKIMIDGLRAFDRLGIRIVDGEELMERTRAVKGEQEVHAMRCAVHACEQALAVMQEAMQSGMTENDVWAVLHAENIRRGGEWIETRLLSSGPRTNPWFQECGPRVLQENDLLAFDTDLVGCYGMCCDISRTWLVGDAEPSAEQRRLYREAWMQIEENRQVLRAGRTLAEVLADCRPLPDEFVARRYSCVLHGVGLCDEWPMLAYPGDFEAERFDIELEPGMTLCLEAYIGSVGGREGVKLEDQVLITESGVEKLSRYPFDARLLG